MKGFQKTKLVVAVALASTLATNVSALTAGFSSPEAVYASNLLGLNSAEVSNQFQYSIDFEGSDGLAGRTTGVSIEIELLNGAEFGTNVLADIGTSIDADNDWYGAGQPCDQILNPGITGCAWTINTLPTGDAAKLNVTLSPGLTPAGLPNDEMVTFLQDNLDVTSLLSTLGAGNDVQATIQVRDPVTTVLIIPATTVTLYSAAEATTTSITSVEGGQGSSTSDALKRIDVGGNGGTGPDDSKTMFSPGTSPATTGPINNPTHVDYFFAGTVTAGLNGVKSSRGTLGYDYDSVSGAVAPAVTTTPGTGTFQFAVSSVDTLDVTVSGTDFSSFTRVWLEDKSNAAVVLGDECNPATLTPAYTATIGGSSASMSAPIQTVTGDSYNVCIQVDGSTVIADQALTATAQIDLDPSVTVYNGLLIDPSGITDVIEPLRYNGDVLEVHYFNDNGNTGAESRLRISNKGKTAGVVTIEAIDDAGMSSRYGASPESVSTAPATPMMAQILIGAGQSVQVTSTNLIDGTGVVMAGTGFKDGSVFAATNGKPTQGKFRFIVTAEYEGLEVTNFIRNQATGGVVNFTKSDLPADNQ